MLTRSRIHAHHEALEEGKAGRWTWRSAKRVEVVTPEEVEETDQSSQQQVHTAVLLIGQPPFLLAGNRALCRGGTSTWRALLLALFSELSSRAAGVSDKAPFKLLARSFEKRPENA